MPARCRETRPWQVDEWEGRFAGRRLSWAVFIRGKLHASAEGSVGGRRGPSSYWAQLQWSSDLIPLMVNLLMPEPES